MHASLKVHDLEVGHGQDRGRWVKIYRLQLIPQVLSFVLHSKVTFRPQMRLETQEEKNGEERIRKSKEQLKA